MYSLLVCADLYGEKCNLEVNFSSPPTIADVQQKLLRVFAAESNLRRPQGHPLVDFTIARIQIYDDRLLKWVDLVSQTQLHEYDQLYVFQPQSRWHMDVQKDLPPPRASLQSCAAPAVQSTIITPRNGRGVSGSPSSRQDASSASANCGVVPSPTRLRLEEQQRRERALQEELARVRNESDRLAREVSIEEEENRLREQEERSRLLRQKEDEVRRQRELLMRLEEEYRRLQMQESPYRLQ